MMQVQLRFVLPFEAAIGDALMGDPGQSLSV
jgi:hypothetical protein